MLRSAATTLTAMFVLLMLLPVLLIVLAWTAAAVQAGLRSLKARDA